MMGFEAYLVQSLPREIAAWTSGDGDVTCTNSRTKFNAGPSSGSEAALTGVTQYPFCDETAVNGVVFQTYFRPRQTPYTDEVAIGLGRPDFTDEGNTRGAYLDLTRGEYVVADYGKTTVAATLPEGGHGAVTLTIVQDFKNDQTTFRQEGTVSEKVTIGKTRDVEGSFLGAHMLSNGNNQRLELQWMRFAYLQKRMAADYL